MQASVPDLRSRFGTWVVVLIATAILATLIGFHFFIPVPRLAVWDAVRPQESLRSLANLGLLLVLYFVTGAAYTAFLTRILYRPPSDEVSRTAFAARSKAALWGLGLSLLLLLAAFAIGKLHIPTVVEFVFPFAGAVFGSYGTWWWLGGWRSKLAFGLQCAVLLGLLIACSIGLSANALETKPLVSRARTVSSAEKRVVMRKFQDSENGDNGERRVVLTEDDIDVLLNMGAAVAEGRLRADGQVGRRDSGSIRVTIPISDPEAPRRFLNGHIELVASIDQGRVKFHIRSLSIGRIEFPGFSRRAIAFAVRDFAERDPHLSQIVRRTQTLSIRNHDVVIAGNWRGLRRSITGRVMAEMGARKELAWETRVYAAHLLETPSPRSLEGDAQFLWLTKQAFDLARRRTARGRDAQEENRAAILALGILVGHSKLERLVGEVLTPELRERFDARCINATMYGRRDWTRHFWLSAALAVLSNEHIGNAVGVLKEELDAGSGGSGFSFGDLAADMAGTRLARLATSSRDSARRIQRGLATVSSIEEVLPLINDLPEGLSDEELARRYDGVDGARYRQLVQEINRRLDTCKLLR